MKPVALSLIAASAFAFLPLISAPAHATAVSGTATFADDGPFNNGLTFSGTANNAAITNLDLALGTPLTISNFLTIQSNDTGGFFGSSATDNISTSFVFTLPASGSGTLNGSGSEDVAAFWGIVTGASGQISWQNPLTIDFNDGLTLTLSLADADFNAAGWFPNPDQTIGDSLTLTLTQADPPASVPEPGSLAVLGTALIGLAFMVRRRRRRS
ncbi:MAG: PEP-CTERM sorting domain-containing protein [Acetobacteraceae bacterium]